MSQAIGVLLRGLPFEADQDDIKQFFSSLSILHNNIDLIITFDGKFSGLAFVRLSDSDEIKIALLMDRNHMGGRYIDVMTVTEEKLDQIRKAAGNGLGRRELHRMCGDNNNRPAIGRGGGGSSRGREFGSTGDRICSRGASFRERSRSPVRGNDQNRFTYFNGFPDDVLYKGVRKFFEDCSIGKGCVHLFRGENGKFRGDGYVEFVDSSQQKKGIRKDGMFFRSHRIDVEACSQEEVYDNLRFMMDRTGPNAFTTEPDPLYGGYRRHEERDHHRSSKERGRSREQHRGERDKWNASGFRRHEDSYDLNHHSAVSSHFEGESRRHNNGDYSHKRLEGYDHRGYRHADHEGYGTHHKGSGATGSGNKTLRMHGIHPSARISDIVSFFRNYGIEYEDVRIQCHDDGTPNGRAFVNFPSERIMSAAFHDMNRRMLKNAYIELFPI